MAKQKRTALRSRSFASLICFTRRVRGYYVNDEQNDKEEWQGDKEG